VICQLLIGGLRQAEDAEEAGEDTTNYPALINGQNTIALPKNIRTSFQILLSYLRADYYIMS
jgi:hypothetical protein